MSIDSPGRMGRGIKELKGTEVINSGRDFRRSYKGGIRTARFFPRYIFANCVASMRHAVADDRIEHLPVRYGHAARAADWP